MFRDNLFDGDSFYVIFARATYDRLINRKWFTYADIMADVDEKFSRDPSKGVSNGEHYGELKKAFRDIRMIINKKLNAECFEEEGNNRNKRFRYIGTEDDPLVDMCNAKGIKDFKQYWQFSQEGFFPSSWLEYFFKDSRDLLRIKTKRQKGEMVLSASLDRILTNIDLVPFLYEAVIRKKVLSIVYKPYGCEEMTLTFHPHYLKEYNGRWFLLGHTENMSPEFGYNIALDRIVGKPQELNKLDYVPAPNGFYKNFFNDIVGVTHPKDAKVETIHIRANKHYMYKLTDTKKIHPSQEVSIPFGKHEDGEYGEFVVKLEPNNEFIGRILQMGEDLEVVSPKEVRDSFVEKVQNLYNLYNLQKNQFE